MQYSLQVPPSPAIHNMDSIDKRNKIRIQGVPEPKNLSNAKRLEHDEEHLKNILETLGEWGESNNINLVKRLGPFNEQSDRTRSLIDKFSYEWTARKGLTKGYKLRNSDYPVFINKSLSKEEVILEKRVLKKRWELMQNGTPKVELKIKNLKLFHNNVEIIIQS